MTPHVNLSGRINWQTLYRCAIVILVALFVKLIWGHNPIGFSSFRNDVVIVTGCDTSIGRQITQSFLDQNATVIMTCAKKNTCDKAASWLAGKYPKASLHSLELDPTSAKSIATFSKDVKSLRLPVHSWVMYTDAYHGFFNFYTEDGINSLYGKCLVTLVEKTNNGNKFPSYCLCFQGQTGRGTAL